MGAGGEGPGLRGLGGPGLSLAVPQRPPGVKLRKVRLPPPPPPPYAPPPPPSGPRALCGGKEGGSIGIGRARLGTRGGGGCADAGVRAFPSQTLKVHERMEIVGGVDARFEDGALSARPVGQVALQLPVPQSDCVDFCTATFSNTQAALGARFRAPLPGDFGAVKGSVKLRLKHGSRRPDLQFSAMPTDKQVLAAGAVGLLASGKGVSYSPDVKLLGGPPRRLRGLELRPRVGVDLDLKARWDRKLRGLAVELRDCNLVIKA